MLSILENSLKMKKNSSRNQKDKTWNENSCLKLIDFFIKS